MLPESYYHLARYYNYFNNTYDEELTLERAIQAFDIARQETPRRLGYRIDSLRRLSEIYIDRGQFFQAEEFLARGVRLYEDGLSRRLITPAPNYGKLYADLGDLEYFVKDGNMAAALEYYRRSERNGYAPPEIQYRMGAAHYQQQQWAEALDRFSTASFPTAFNRKILYALGNVSYLRGNYFAAQAYYDRLLELLDGDRARFPQITPTNNAEQLELAERYMVAQNNLGATLEALSLRTGDNSYRSRAQGLYTESEGAWDVITRNPDSFIRLRPSPEMTGPGVNPAFLNIQNSLSPTLDYEPQFFLRIDMDLLEPSVWDELAPQGFRLSEGLSTGLF
jgi:tetratricopeptide (TPR) repeat protein